MGKPNINTDNNGLNDDKVTKSVQFSKDHYEYLEQFRAKYGYSSLSNVIRLFIRVGMQVHANRPDEFFQLVEDSSDVIHTY